MKLSQNMVDLLTETEPGKVMAKGPTRAALIRRGMVHPLNGGSQSAGMLTPKGIAQRELLIYSGPFPL